MTYLLLIAVIALGAVQSVCAKEYSLRSKNYNMILFSFVSVASALLFFVVSCGFKFSFDPGLLLYSVGFGIAYAAAVIGLFLSICYGSFALTSLINSYSLIIPTTYGLIFLNEKLKSIGILGIIFLVISLFLINAKGDKMKFSLKWIISIIITFAGNGMCSTIQKMQQAKFDGAYKNEFMILALLIISVCLLIYIFIKKDNIKTELSSCIKYGIPKGVANGIVNMLVMFLTAMLPVSILFPSISAGGVITTFALSKLIYKEKLTVMQNIGFIFGVCAIILLNL